MNATNATLPHHAGIRSISASVQTGPATLVIDSIEPDAYGPGLPAISYRVVADVRPYYGQMPVPGSTWCFQAGRTNSSMEELTERCASLYGAGNGEGHFLHYRGPMSGFPYRSAISDEQIAWCKREGITVDYKGGIAILSKGRRSCELRGDGTAEVAGQPCTPKRAVAYVRGAAEAGGF